MNARLIYCFAALLIGVVLTVSCRSPEAAHESSEAQALVWPPPPDPPRVTYIKSISNPSDIGRSPSALKRVVRFITGGPSEREGLLKPFGIALDEVGNICLTDTGNNTAYHLDLAGKRWRRWSAAGKKLFMSPVAIACRKG